MAERAVGRGERDPYEVAGTSEEGGPYSQGAVQDADRDPAALGLPPGDPVFPSGGTEEESGDPLTAADDETRRQCSLVCAGCGASYTRLPGYRCPRCGRVFDACAGCQGCSARLSARSGAVSRILDWLSSPGRS